MYSFSTRLHEDTTINDGPVIFGTVDLNIGDGYDEFTGNSKHLARLISTSCRHCKKTQKHNITSFLYQLRLCSDGTFAGVNKQLGPDRNTSFQTHLCLHDLIWPQ